jgi:hypothetical protein
MNEMNIGYASSQIDSTLSLHACPADDANPPRTPIGVDDAGKYLLFLVSHRVLGLGHFRQAKMEHSYRAPTPV